MKFILLLAVLFLAGCSADIESVAEQPLETSQEKDNSETIELCNSLCGSNSEEYCLSERTVFLDEKEVTGTCRSFAKKGAIPGFRRCQGFCNSYPSPEPLK